MGRGQPREHVYDPADFTAAICEYVFDAGTGTEIVRLERDGERRHPA